MNKLSYRRENAQRTRYVSKFDGSCYVLRGIGVRKVSNSKCDLQGHSRVLAMMPFDRPRTISYQTSIATNFVLRIESIMCFVFDIHVYFKHYFYMYFMHINVSGRSVLLSIKLTYLAPFPRYFHSFPKNLKRSRHPEHIPFGGYHSCISTPLYQSAHDIWSALSHRLQRYDWAKLIKLHGHVTLTTPISVLFRTIALVSHASKIILQIILKRIRVKPKQKLQTNRRDSDEEGRQKTKSWISEYWCTMHANNNNHSICALWTSRRHSTRSPMIHFGWLWWKWDILCTWLTCWPNCTENSSIRSK